MVHGQLPRRKFSTAVMAYAGGKLALPPLACTQLPRLLALAANFCLADFHEKGNGFHLSAHGGYLYNRSRFLK